MIKDSQIRSLRDEVAHQEDMIVRLGKDKREQIHGLNKNKAKSKKNRASLERDLGKARGGLVEAVVRVDTLQPGSLLQVGQGDRHLPERAGQPGEAGQGVLQGEREVEGAGESLPNPGGGAAYRRAERGQRRD